MNPAMTDSSGMNQLFPWWLAIPYASMFWLLATMGRFVGETILQAFGSPAMHSGLFPPIFTAPLIAALAAIPAGLIGALQIALLNTGIHWGWKKAKILSGLLLVSVIYGLIFSFLLFALDARTDWKNYQSIVLTLQDMRGHGDSLDFQRSQIRQLLGLEAFSAILSFLLPAVAATLVI